MTSGYKLIPRLDAEAEVPRDGILSRPLHDDDSVKVVLFAFSDGQELSEHTASKPAILQFLAGEADLRLGGEEVQAGPGSWVHMNAGLSHAVRARGSVVMLLTLLKRG